MIVYVDDDDPAPARPAGRPSRKPWPVIVVIAVGWAVATVLAFTIAALHELAPVHGGRARGRRPWHRDLFVAASRRAQWISRRTERTRLNSFDRRSPWQLPLLQAQIDINAPVAKVWALVADVRQMPQWSPQCRMMRTLGPVRQGARTVNFNRRGLLFWPTTSRIIEFVPEQKLSFRVNENGRSGAMSGTDRHRDPADRDPARRERRQAGVQSRGHRFMGGVPSFEQELVEGMNQSLARIKSAAEG